MRSRKFRLETEVDGLIAKYDEFMTGQQEEIENIQEAYDIEKEQLDELRARYEKLKGSSVFLHLYSKVVQLTTIKSSKNVDLLQRKKSASVKSLK